MIVPISEPLNSSQRQSTVETDFSSGDEITMTPSTSNSTSLTSREGRIEWNPVFYDKWHHITERDHTTEKNCPPSHPEMHYLQNLVRDVALDEPSSRNQSWRGYYSDDEWSDVWNEEILIFVEPVLLVWLVAFLFGTALFVFWA